MSDLAWSPEPGEILSVGELVARARGALEAAFATVWVEGEVSNARVPVSGHAYFTLGDAKAQLRAVCFRSTLRLLRVTPEDGLRVLARGRLTVYEARGDIQLVVEDLEPEGEGLLRLELEARKRRLAAEGLFEAGRKRPLPALPRAVGVVTSATGAAIRDILQVLARRAPGVDVYLAPARVQGDGAAEELRDALDLVASHAEVDVVILGRGGGSAEDLGAFNDEELVRAVAVCPVPVVAAVGHEIDVTLVDFAADVRAPTPSAAAELVGREWSEWSERVRRSEQRLERGFSARVGQWRGRLERLDPWRSTPRARLDRLRLAVDRATDAQRAAVERGLLRRRARIGELGRHLAHGAPSRRLAEVAARARGLEDRLAAAAAAAIGDRRRRLAVGDARLRALSPLAVLGRGYAIARSADGTILRDAARCQTGDDAEVMLARGSIDCRITAVRPRARED